MATRQPARLLTIVSAVIMLLTCLSALPVTAGTASITPVGVIGNSGVEGKSLLRTSVDKSGPQAGGGFIDSRSPSGAWIDARTGIWIGYLNVVNNISLAGRLIEQHPLLPAGARIDSLYFTALDGTLYFFAHDTRPVAGGSDYAVYALRMEPGAKAEPFVKTPGIPSSKPAVICPQPVQGRILFSSYDENGCHLELLDPKTKESVTLLAIPNGETIRGLAYDRESNSVIIGGFFGRKDPARLNHPIINELICLELDGTIKWRCGEYFMEGIGAQDYLGVFSLAGGAIWDSSWTGLFGRRNMAGQPSPGKLSFGGKVDYSTQFIDVRAALSLPDQATSSKDLLFVASHDYSAMYFATWDKQASLFELQRRVGCLPGVQSINIGPDGSISLASVRYPWSSWVLEVDQYWWKWDDAPDAPPHEANGSYGTTNGYYDRDGNLAVLQNPYPWNTNPHMLLLKPGGTNEPLGPLPFKTPAGMTLDDMGGDKFFAFATDSETKSIWKCPLGKDLTPAGKWEKIELSGVELQTAGDIVALQQGIVAVADTARICIFDCSGGSGKLLTTLEKWGEKPDEQFGKRLYLATDQGILVVSDSDRQRIVTFTSADGKYLAQFGETDVPGDDLSHLRNPRKVAIRGDKIAISDYDNQRVLTCVIKR